MLFLRQSPTGELIRRHGIAKQTLYRWRAKYGGLEVSDAWRLRQLEEENRRLKRLVGDQALQLQGPAGSHNKIVVTVERRRTTVTQVLEIVGRSARWAC